jgi:hypothetical protein
MNTVDPKYFHRTYGEQTKRISYKTRDFIDYIIMSILCSAVIYFSYGAEHFITIVGLVLSAYMIIVFPIRHGWQIEIPVIIKRPRDILFTIIYKLQNIKAVYLFAISFLLLENHLIYLTPTLPHNTALMHEIALYLFYLHLIGITIYRTYILYVHLCKKELVREVLTQTSWKRVILNQPNITLEILHAYFTGLLTHLILIAPWFIVITYAKYSVIFLPVIVVINIFTEAKFIKVINLWFYRDHWLGHNVEVDFVYLHGTHHDAIPSALIGVAGNGLLEGFMRHSLGSPAPFFNPIVSAIVYSVVVQQDMEGHQFIPGLYPTANIEFQKINQHSMHHFGKLAPYGIASNVDQADVNEKFKARYKIFPDEFKNAIKLDEQLAGYEWYNAKYKKYLDLVAKYEK